MNYLEFFSNHTFLAFLVIFFGYCLIRYAMSIIKQIVRMPVLLIHGWPSAPFDADGDIHYPSKESNDEARK